MSVVDSLLPLHEQRLEFVASSDDTSSALDVVQLVLLLPLVDHLREGLGETGVHLLDVLSTLVLLLGTDLFLAPTLLCDTTLEHGTTHLLELRFLLLRNGLLKSVVLTLHLGTHFLDLIGSHLTSNHVETLSHVLLFALQDFVTTLVHLDLDLGSFLLHGQIQIVLKLS